MSTLELVLNMLAEATTTEMTKEHDPIGLQENREIAKRGGQVAGQARRAIEADTGKPVVSPQNAIDFTRLIESVNEHDSH